MIRLPEGSWWDWEIVSWEPGRLCLGAGYDLAYHHGLELILTEPHFVACPASFQDPVFREPTRDELRLVLRQTGETPAVLIAFEADAGGPGPASGLIAAERLAVHLGTVYRYWRSPLAPGERLAPWVVPPAP
ncbi:hypothetical protein ACWGB8_08615 [Kitasatospora sp. NPDC054939]